MGTLGSASVPGPECGGAGQEALTGRKVRPGIALTSSPELMGGVGVRSWHPQRRIECYPHLRHVAPLYVEVFHLLVKEEYAGSVRREPSRSARTRGRHRSARPGPPRAWPSPSLPSRGWPLPPARRTGGAAVHSLELADLEALVERGDRKALPDAASTSPPCRRRSRRRWCARGDIASCRSPSPMPSACRRWLPEDPTDGLAMEIERPLVVETVIPGFAYGTDSSAASASANVGDTAAPGLPRARIPRDRRALPRLPRKSVAATQASPDGRTVRSVHAARGRGRAVGRGA